MLAIYRTADRLTTLACSREGAFAPPPPPGKDGQVPPLLPRYALVEPSADAYLAPGPPHLRDAWARLAGVRAWDAATLADVLIVLLETLPSPPARPAGLPQLPADPAARRPRPTAAHPRAFRGTRYRPPKSRRLGPLDLRPYLHHPRHLELVLRRLRHHLPAALTRLAGWGYDRASLAHVADAGSGGLAIYLAYHHRHRAAPTDAPLPAWFVAQVLPRLRGVGWSAVLAHLGLACRLELDRRPDLRAAVVQFLAADFGTAVPWLLLLGDLPAAARLPCLTILLETGTYRLGPAGWAGVAQLLRECPTLPSCPAFAHRLHFFLTALQRGVAADYLCAGLRLADDLGRPDYAFASESLGAGCHLDPAAIRALAVPGAGGDYGPLYLWEACGMLPGLAALLPQLGLPALAPAAARALLRWLIHLDPSRAWAQVRPVLLPLAGLVGATPPDYQAKLANALVEVFWGAASPARWAADRAFTTAVCQRLAGPPFAADGDLPLALGAALPCLPAADRPAFLALPDAALAHLEKACRRRNDARLLAGGLAALFAGAGARAVAALARWPAALCRAARVLGCLGPVERRQVLAAWQAHPLVAADPAGLEVADLARRVDQAALPGTPNPVPRRLRDHLAGRCVLRPGQVERHGRVLRENLSAARVALLEELALRRLAGGLVPEVSDDATRHAVQLACWIDLNKRALRRFLRAHAAGRRDYLLRHPRTVAWLAHHPNLDVERWTRGLRLAAEVPGVGRVRLALERDPLEKLRLGTYVGSCLGLGGGFAYSAAAVALDLNKQVVYARDAAGRVVARQLLALAEERQLVAFAVYPAGTTAPLRRLFHRYVRRFAAALGLPLYAGGDYTVRNLLAAAWWDDGPGADAEPLARSPTRSQNA